MKLSLTCTHHLNMFSLHPFITIHTATTSTTTTITTTRGQRRPTSRTINNTLNVRIRQFFVICAVHAENTVPTEAHCWEHLGGLRLFILGFCSKKWIEKMNSRLNTTKFCVHTYKFIISSKEICTIYCITSLPGVAAASALFSMSTSPSSWSSFCWSLPRLVRLRLTPDLFWACNTLHGVMQEKESG